MFTRCPRTLFASALMLVWVSVALAAPATNPDPHPAAAVAMPSATTPATVSVTWDDILRAAEKNPLFAAGESNVAAARAGVRVAGVAPNPSLSASAAWADPDDADPGAEWSLEVSVPLGWLASRPSATRAARAELDTATAEAEGLRREALARLRELFWQVAIDQRRVETYEQEDRELSALSRAVKLRVDRGESRPVELTRVEVEAEKAAGELDSARLRLAGSREQLRGWLNLPPGVAVIVVADPATLPPVPARAAAPVADPRVAAARARVREREAERDGIRLGGLPEVELSPFVEEELDVSRSGIGLTTPLPLWDWNTAPVARADARLAAARAELRAAEMTAESDLASARTGCEAATSAAARWRDRIVPRAASAAATVERTYELGEADLLEMIDARRTLLSAERDYLDTLDRARSECGRLYALTGEDQP